MDRSNSMLAPITECVFITSNSSAVSRLGLFNIASEIEIFPISCSAEAVLIKEISALDKGYWSVSWTNCFSKYFVIVFTCRICRPLSPLRNSTIWERIEIISLLFFSCSWNCSAIIFSRRCCLAYKNIVLEIRRWTMVESKGRLI